MSKTITLTDTEIWFIKCAISLKGAVLPLEESCLDEKIFKEDYGISKSDAIKAIDSLYKKLTK